MTRRLLDRIDRLERRRGGPQGPAGPAEPSAWNEPLPANPADGQVVLRGTPGVGTDAGQAGRFLLRYSAAANAWEGIGGPGVIRAFTTPLSFAATTSYQGPFPGLVAPYAGDYIASFSCQVRSTSQASAGQIIVSLGTTTPPEIGMGVFTSNGVFTHLMFEKPITLPAGQLLRRYGYAPAAIGGTPTLDSQVLRLMPVRIPV